MHHRKLNRLKHYDYSRAGYYFVTICTHNREQHFGRIESGAMVRNPVGEIVNQFWLEIPLHFPMAELDCHIVMPNHVHGIIIIHDMGDVENAVGNAYMHSLQQPGNNKIPHQYRTKMLICKIIQQYKSAVTRKINKLQLNSNFKWQKSFYDHIIRNDFSLYKIRKYIVNNPLKWEYDRENQNDVSIEEKERFWKQFLRDL